MSDRKLKLPAISAQLLAEYCYAHAIRRRGIMEQICKPDFEPYMNWYGEVPNAYRRYLDSPLRSPLPLDHLEENLRNRPANSEHDEDRILKQLEAIEYIRRFDHALILGERSTPAFRHESRSLPIAGITVRVNATNIILQERLGHKYPLLGLIKPYLKSTMPLSKSVGEMYAMLMHWLAETELSHIGEPTPKLCMITDIFAGAVYRAPRAQIKLRSLATAACEEISERWTAYSDKAASSRRKGRDGKADPKAV